LHVHYWLGCLCDDPTVINCHFKIMAWKGKTKRRACQTMMQLVLPAPDNSFAATAELNMFSCSFCSSASAGAAAVCQTLTAAYCRCCCCMVYHLLQLVFYPASAGAAAARRRRRRHPKLLHNCCTAAAATASATVLSTVSRSWCSSCPSWCSCCAATMMEPSRASS
jgi:hypothetical protein